MNRFIKRVKGFLKHYLHTSLTKVANIYVLNPLFVVVQSFAFMFLLSADRNRKNLGALQARPTVGSLLYGCIGMFFNLNHLGSVYLISPNRLNISSRMEREVIEWVKHLFRVKDKNVEGYVSSGGTESNLFAMWSLRDYMLKKKPSKICVIVSPLTHYSILKAARILNIEIIYTPLNLKSWSMDPILLKKTIMKVIRRGVANIMIPVTLGYPSTGTCDSLPDIDSILSAIDKKYSKARCVIWADAAAQGLPIAYLNRHFEPFKYKHLYAIGTDFHKLGNAPIPSSIVLFRKQLRVAIQTKISYLAESDVTIGGSRPGFIAMGMWANMRSGSHISRQKDFYRSEQIKNYFIRQFISYFPKKNIIHTRYSMTCAIIVDQDFRKLPTPVEEKYSLYLGSIVIDSNQNTLRHYKIHFMTDISQKIIDEFMNDMTLYQKSV